jgi:hypothetical protein
MDDIKNYLLETDKGNYYKLFTRQGFSNSIKSFAIQDSQGKKIKSGFKINKIGDFLAKDIDSEKIVGVYNSLEQIYNVFGFVHFESKKEFDLKTTSKLLNLGELAQIYFFKNIKRYNKKLNHFGIIIMGRAKYNSQQIIELIKKRLGIKIKGCDISTGFSYLFADDVVKPIKRAKLQGSYIGIRIKSPYKIKDVYDSISQIDKLLEPVYLGIRTVERDSSFFNKSRPNLCIDIISRADFQRYKNKIEELLMEKNIEIEKEKYVFFDLDD